MKAPGAKGITLVELLMALAVLSILAAAGAGLLSAYVQVQGDEGGRTGLYQEGILAMDRITSEIRTSTYVLVPNARASIRDILALSGTVNDDGDSWFGDPLFPRIDEDASAKMDGDDFPGVRQIDDDGDGSVDESIAEDDDEDGLDNEDPLDGLDNDLDGLLDEDTRSDMNSDNEPGIAQMDDDGDGSVDEGSNRDDDEDGLSDEDPLNPSIYSVPGGTSTLQVHSPHNGQTAVVTTRVSFFRVTWEAPERILVQLTLTAEDGKSLAFSEYACPRNARQKAGKRVR